MGVNFFLEKLPYQAGRGVWQKTTLFLNMFLNPSLISKRLFIHPCHSMILTVKVLLAHQFFWQIYLKPVSHQAWLHLGCHPLLFFSPCYQRNPPGGAPEHWIGWFLFWWISEFPILHAPKLLPLLHWFQNCFCFCSTTFPSHVGTFFGLQWRYQ